AEGAAFTTEEGRQIHFARAGQGWDRGAGENFWLAHESRPPKGIHDRSLEGVLVVRDNCGGWWAFTPSGAWLGSGSGPGSVVTVDRNSAGHVIRLNHEFGRHLDIEYVDDRVAYIQASDGRRIEYCYDADRRLTKVHDGVGTRSYRWNDAGLIDRVVAATGIVECVNTYDAQGRVTEQLTPYGRTVRFAYLDGRVTSVSDPDGTNTNTWISDRQGRVVGIIDTDGMRQSMAYDPAGNLVSVTERDGQTTVHAYDERGRRTRTVTPEGADLTYGYDEWDRVTAVVAASGATVLYAYASEHDRSPGVVTDSVGGRTELLWERGLLTQLTDPTGVTVSNEYDEHGELACSRNAVGNTARLVRDPAGRVIAAITPAGERTTYAYTAAGLLISRTDPDGGTWQFERGAGGRVTAEIDPFGGRTSYEYGPHGKLTRTTDPLGRSVTHSYTQLETLDRVTLADGSSWGFTHDALSRLREITDPAGGVWSRLYSAAGELTGTIDPTGVRVDIQQSRTTGMTTVESAFQREAIQHDEFGRPVRVEAADGTGTLLTYDAAGRTVEVLDADGGLTSITRDMAGRAIAVTTPTGRTTRYEYDSCGRPVAAIDAAGGLTRLSYDANSRISTRTSPEGLVTKISYDEMGRVIREDVPGVGIARYRYDLAGRLVFSHDVRFGMRRYAYDAAGQLITATNGSGGVTRFGYDLRGRVTTITDPLGGVTRRSYTHLDYVDSTTDPLGRVTTATYDAAGRQLTQTSPDGDTLTREYDAAGAESAVRANGRLLVRTDRDARTRMVTIHDETNPEAPVTHTLRFNRTGQLVERVTGDEVTLWRYDADGSRIEMAAPDGNQIRYERDAVGRLARIAHTSFGELTFAHDRDGNLQRAQASLPAPGHSSETMQRWEYEHGFATRHTQTSAAQIDTTHIVRDDLGRVVRIDGPEGVVEYRSDDACQLTGVLVDGTEVAAWEYDVAGRLTTETRSGAALQYTYDAAGQLTRTVADDGTVVEYHYDSRGRRVCQDSPAGRTHFAWDARGWLTGVSERTAATGTDAQDGGRTLRETALWVNALGELAAANGAAIQWDTAAQVPTPLNIGGASSFAAPAGFSGVGNAWAASGWRTARTTTSDDPWSPLLQATASEALAGGVGLTVAGGLQVAGLEWMGARAYDSVTRGFLSVDPLEPPTGAAWSANPYAFAGNDPLHATDPLGLAPVSDAALRGYALGLQGPLAKAESLAGRVLTDTFGSIQRTAASVAEGVGNFIDEHAVILGSVAVVAGVALMFTGVGGPIGIALIGAASGALVSGGVSVASQKIQNGSVDWGKAGTDTLIGGVGGAVGGAVASGLSRGAQALAPSVRITGDASSLGRVAYGAARNPLSRAALANGGAGGTSNALDYHLNAPSPTATGYLQSFGTGFGTSAMSALAAPGLASQMPNGFVGGLTDSGIGGIQAVGNELLRPGGNSDPENLMYVGLQGAALGGSGPKLGLHVGGT
ncbi:MAG: type IV secretion protein Rhs, partial [Leucobacter sp.]|nr:type IV secretion protein Rhs [Leucobacter sp.]